MAHWFYRAFSTLSAAKFLVWLRLLQVRSAKVAIFEASSNTTKRDSHTATQTIYMININAIHASATKNRNAGA